MENCAVLGHGDMPAAWNDTRGKTRKCCCAVRSTLTRLTMSSRDRDRLTPARSRYIVLVISLRPWELRQQDPLALLLWFFSHQEHNRLKRLAKADHCGPPICPTLFGSRHGVRVLD